MERVREKISSYTGRRITKSTGAVTSSSYYSTERVTDIIAPGDNHPFYVSRSKLSGGTLTGETASTAGYIFDGLPATWVPVSINSHLTVPGRPSNGLMASSLLARTQPFRGELVWQEYLSELPLYGSAAHDLFKKGLDGLGNLIPPDKFGRLQVAAKINLLVQFGLLPLYGDIQTLLKFQERVDYRAKELGRLYGGNGLRRTVALWSGSNTTTTHNRGMHSSGVSLKASVTVSSTVNVRGHVRWTANTPISTTDASLRSAAKAHILNYGLDPHTLYELMPWSWFIDYFTNLGSIIKGANNMMELKHDTPRIMTEQRTTTQTSNHTEYSSGPYRVYMVPFKGELITKNRVLAPATLQARSSILTGRQTSILGSLAVLRF